MSLHVIVKKRFTCPFCVSSIFVHLGRVNEEDSYRKLITEKMKPAIRLVHKVYTIASQIWLNFSLTSTKKSKVTYMIRLSPEGKNKVVVQGSTANPSTNFLVSPGSS